MRGSKERGVTQYSGKMRFSQSAGRRAAKLAVRLALAGGLLWCAGAAPPVFGQMSESFEYGVPPPGWTKTNLLGGSGWYQLPVGVMPLPGWGNGTSSVPATANAGTHNAYCSWTTGGGAAEGYHSDQWLISPRLTGLTATSTVSYWLRFNFTNFPDTVYFRVSTNGPAPANFTFVPLTNRFARASYTNQFPPWSNHVVNVGALGIPAGTPIWIAIQEYEWDNTWNESALQLDVINSDLTAPPEARVGPTSLTFTAYYEGGDPAPQTFALQGVGSSGMGYSRGVAFGAGGTNWLALGGPVSGTLGFQGSQTYTAGVSVAGLDLGTYVATNVFTVPGATNNPLRVPITLNVIRRPQAIAFPNPGPQYTTNKVGLAGTSSSGLPVTFSVFSGPGSIVGATNLSFTGTGTVRVVAWQLGNVYYDVAPCVTQAMAVTKPNAAISFTNLSHVYDGAPHGATATTVPAGLAVDTTYNGSASLPVAIGSYAVTCTVNDVLYGGTATATYTITKMVQTVAFPDPGEQWTTNHVGLAATANSGLPVAFAVASGPGTISDGTNLSFTGAGAVSVVASQAGNADWLPAAATNSIAVSKAVATVALGSLAQTYDGTAKSAAATTVPAGLAVEFTYDGSGAAPAAAGSYVVTGTVNEAMYRGADVGTLVIGKGAATVTLTNLSQTYDGTPRNAAATTAPAGLAVEFTYDGSTNAPTARGSYAVTGAVHEANWQGSATGTLTIGMGAATVTLESLAQAYDGTAKHATATTAPAGLAVEFTYDGETNGPVAVGGYAVTGTVNDADWAGSATGTLTIGKGNATVTLGDLDRIYDGTAKSATATTVPAGLAVDLAYDGSATAPTAVGSYAVTGTVNDANWRGSATGTLTIGKAMASVVLASLAQTYDGTGKTATATTEPAGLAVDFTYDGSPTAPSNAGSYAVTGRVNDADWQGSATGTLVVGKAAATVVLGSLAQTCDGTGKSATATTEPAGLAVDFTYDGTATAPSNAGVYAVTGAVNEANYQGFAAGVLTIGKGAATVELGSLAHTCDGTPKTATATTVPAGLAVDFTYDGAATAPSNAGSFAVTGAVNEANWQGSATGTLTIGKGVATVVLGSLAQAYDGTPKPATATTAPAGLAVDFTYDGSATAPSNVGVYAVTGAVNDANYEGSSAGTLTIGKGAATVVLESLSQAYDGTPKPATATTVPAGLAVDFTYDGAPAAPTAAGGYAVTGTVNDASWQGSSAGALTILKGTQFITNFLPADGEMFDLGEVATASAQASGGGPVEFANLTPAIATLAGTAVTFLRPGLARVQAFQAGDANWNPVSLVHGWRVLNPQNAQCDFDGDGKADLAVYHPAAGMWYIRESSTGVRRDAAWGWNEAVPVPGDYDGDGRTDVAVYHPAAGTWHLACSSAGSRTVQWGWNGAVPVPGDYDGDGRTDVAVFQPVSGLWYLACSTAGSRTEQWGGRAMIPAPADYDADGVTDLAAYHPLTGNWRIRNSATGEGRPSVAWGWSEAVPVPGDYDGDGAADIAVFHPATGDWYLLCSSAGIRTVKWGWSETTPVPADYDGDGAADILAYHRAAGHWYARENLAGLPPGIISFGWSAANPVLLQPLINSRFGLP